MTCCPIRPSGRASIAARSTPTAGRGASSASGGFGRASAASEAAPRRRAPRACSRRCSAARSRAASPALNPGRAAATERSRSCCAARPAPAARRARSCAAPTAATASRSSSSTPRAAGGSACSSTTAAPSRSTCRPAARAARRSVSRARVRRARSAAPAGDALVRDRGPAPSAVPPRGPGHPRRGADRAGRGRARRADHGADPRRPGSAHGAARRQRRPHAPPQGQGHRAARTAAAATSTCASW